MTNRIVIIEGLTQRVLRHAREDLSIAYQDLDVILRQCERLREDLIQDVLPIHDAGHYSGRP